MKKYFSLIFILLLVISFCGCTNSTDKSDEEKEDEVNCENGHTWEQTSKVDADCVNAGTINYKCTVCGETKTETIDALGHDFSSDWTIGEEGTHYHVCSRCGEKADEAEHTYDNDTYTCVCGKKVDGYKVTFTYTNIEGVSILVYDTQDTTVEGKTYTSNTLVYARTDLGVITNDGESQVNFKIVVPEGYEVGDITATEGLFKNIKALSTDENIYRVTKITGDINIDIEVKEEVPEETGFKVTFVYDKNIEGFSIIVYNTQDALEGDTYTDDATFLARTDLGVATTDGESQVNFKIVIPEGYTLDAISADTTLYKNLKVVDEANNVYRLTKIKGDIEITVTLK